MYAFVHIDKTAGRTVRAVLRRPFGAGHCEIRTPYARRPGDRHDRSVYVTAADLRRVRRICRHLRGIAGHNVKPYSDLVAACPQFRPEYRPVNRLVDKERPRDVAALRQRNQQVTDWREPLPGRMLRNWVYEPALLRLA